MRGLIWLVVVYALCASAPAQTVPPGDLEQTFDELAVSLATVDDGGRPAILLRVTARNDHVIEDIWYSEITHRLMIVASPAAIAVTDPRAAGLPVRHIGGIVPTDGTDSLIFQIHVRETPATPTP